jgi:hypothetical protein
MLSPYEVQGYTHGAAKYTMTKALASLTGHKQ